MTWSPYKTVCICGHDIDTHYRDPATGHREACLGSRCECKQYVDHLAPPQSPEALLPTPVVPAAPPRDPDLGDRVRIRALGSWNGRTGEVLEIRALANGAITARVRYDGGGEDWWLLAHLEVI